MKMVRITTVVVVSVRWEGHWDVGDSMVGR